MRFAILLRGRLVCLLCSFHPVNIFLESHHMTFLKFFNRRRLLVGAAASLTAFVFGCIKGKNQAQKQNNSKNKSTTTDAGTSSSLPNADAGANGGSDAGAEPSTTPQSDAGEEEVIDCSQTDNDIEGPFYRPNVPVRSELDLYGDAGTELTLSGQVLDLDCNPIPNAVVDIWHADPTDVPVADLVDSDSVDYDNSSSEMRYRGQTATDTQGRYGFHTKKPGWYLNGGTFRPMHIHVKVWVGDNLKLTSQLYFAGDPYIAGDPWASLDRAVVLSADGPGAEKGTFNFVIS